MWRKILTMVLVLVMVLSFTACEKEPSAQEIVDSVIESYDNIRTYQLDMEVTFDLAGEDEGEAFEITQAMGYLGAMDIEKKQLRMALTFGSRAEAQSEMLRGSELYFIDGMLYMMSKVPGEEPQWMKEVPEEGWWEEIQQYGYVESQIGLLEGAQVEVIGSERVGGIDCYILEVTPDLEQLWQLSHHLHFDEAPDVTEEYLQEIFRSFSVKHWVAKDTYFLMRAEVDIAEEFPPEEAGPSKVDISVVLLCENYNQPVSIELPPEAEEAIGVPME